MLGFTRFVLVAADEARACGVRFIKEVARDAIDEDEVANAMIGMFLFGLFVGVVGAGSAIIVAISFAL